VGGIVRDLLLERSNFDIDLVIVGSAIDFTQKLNRELNAKIKIYQKFNTAKLVFVDGLEIDFATSRKERYKKPAALPEIIASDLKSDMFRRDFTINALALSLNKKDYGVLIDYFNGKLDIQNKIIRVLHDNSFIDDPTRIIRAIRFEQRLGFKISEHTEKLIKQAVDFNIFEKLSSYRLTNELELIYKEKNAGKIKNRIKQLCGQDLIS
jgi:tRNA nucleotidyltransferase (CCA-adding enzyme)